MTETARYAYAVSRDLDEQALDGLTGLRGGPLQVVTCAGLGMVVSDVPLEEFDEEGLRANLEQLSWLEEVARVHDDVVRLVAAQGPVAPLRLATIFRHDSAVRARLEESGPAMKEVLDRVDGRAEWSVKVVAPAPGAPEQTEPEPASGAEFLRRRKAQTEDRGRRLDDLARVAEEVHEALAQAAVANRVLPAQDPQLTGLSGTMALNGAYLVDLLQRQRFEQQLRELRARFPEVTVESAGPWPPYSFAVLEQA